MGEKKEKNDKPTTQWLNIKDIKDEYIHTNYISNCFQHKIP